MLTFRFYLARPNKNTDKLNESCIPSGQFLKARKETPILFELVDAAFDQMTFLVEVIIIVFQYVFVLSWWNHWLCTLISNFLTEGLAIIPLITNHKIGMIPID